MKIAINNFNYFAPEHFMSETDRERIKGEQAMFNNLKIGAKLGLGFGGILVLMIVLILVAFSNMGDIQRHLDRIVKVNYVRTGLTANMGDNVREVSIAIRNMFLVKDPAQRQEMARRIGEERTLYDEAFKKVDDMTNKDDVKGHEVVAKVKAAQEAARSGRVLRS